MVVYDRRLRHAQFLVSLLDNRFSFLGKRIGLDPFLDVIPYAGSFIGLLISFYLVWIAIMNRVRFYIVAKMLILIGFDYMLGSIPFVGMVADALFHANQRNLDILKKEFGIDEDT